MKVIHEKTLHSTHLLKCVSTLWGVCLCLSVFERSICARVLEWVCGVTALMCMRVYVTNITMWMELRLQQIVCSISLLLWVTMFHIVQCLLNLASTLIPVSRPLDKTQHITYTPYETEQPPMKVKSNETSFNLNV